MVVAEENWIGWEVFHVASISFTWFFEQLFVLKKASQPGWVKGF